MADISESLWTEKYRPKTISELTLPKHLIEMVNGIAKNPSSLQNMIFYGPAGCSKTTTAKAIAKTIGAEYLFINAALDAGKDTLSEMILPFATGISMSDNPVPKIVILDEGDRQTPMAADAMKSLIEQVSKTTRFIITSNNIAKIIEPLKSRCQCYDFSFGESDYPYMQKTFIKHFIGDILKEEGCDLSNLEKEDKVKICDYIKSIFPDLRRVLNTFQSYYISHGTIDVGICEVIKADNSDQYINAMGSGDFNVLKAKIIELNEQPADFFKCISDGIDKFPDPIKADVILILAEYQYRNSFSINPEINTLACAIEIMNLLTKGE